MAKQREETEVFNRCASMLRVRREHPVDEVEDQQLHGWSFRGD